VKKHAIPVEELTSLCQSVDGTSAIYVSIPEENERFMLNEQCVFRAASTIKIPVISLLFQDAEEGRVDLNRKIMVKPENRVGGSGILRSLSPDLEMNLFDLANLMIVMSDNIATNEVIDAVGMDRVRQFCKENGYNNTWIWRKMFCKGPEEPCGLPKDAPLNATCAYDLGVMLERIASGTMVSKAASEQIVKIMAGQRLGRFRTALPYAERVEPHVQTLALPAEGKVIVASKGGTLTDYGILHDSAIFYLPDGRYYIMAMLTESSSVAAADKIIQQAGIVMYEAMK